MIVGPNGLRCEAYAGIRFEESDRRVAICEIGFRFLWVKEVTQLVLQVSHRLLWRVAPLARSGIGRRPRHARGVGRSAAEKRLFFNYNNVETLVMSPQCSGKPTNPRARHEHVARKRLHTGPPPSPICNSPE